MSEQAKRGAQTPAGRLHRPLVTIVTPSYNQGRFIEQTILSVLEQDYPSIEYLVMDGGSRDETLDILHKYSNQLVFISEKDRGQAHAINKGFRRAQGDILAFLNSDDTYLPGAVSAAVQGLQENPAAPFLYGEAYSIDEDGRILDRYPTEPFSSERLRDTCFICQPAVFMPRFALEQAGFLEEGLNYCLDYEFWIRLSRLGRPAYTGKYLANTRVYATTKTLGQRRQCHWEIARMWKGVDGRVPTAWVFGLAHAIIETRFKLDRTKPKQNAVFILMLSILSAWLFLYLNQEIQRGEARQILEWIRALARGARTLVFKTS